MNLCKVIFLVCNVLFRYSSNSTILTVHSCLVFSTLFGGKICSNMLGSFRSRIFFSPPKSDVHSHLSLTLYTDKLTPSERTAFKKASRWLFVFLLLGLESLSSCKNVDLVQILLWELCVQLLSRHRNNKL